jgi:hypothetical protein
MGDRIQEYQRGILDNRSLINTQERSFFPKLSSDVLVLRDLWLNKSGITRRQIIEKYNLSPGQVSYLLRNMLLQGLVVKGGRGQATCYYLHPDAFPSTSS